MVTSEQDEKPVRSRKYARFARIVAVGGSLAVLAAIALYAAYLGGWQRQSVSGASGDWGTFGDFVGGVAGTIVAVLTLWAVATTLRAQAEELEATRVELNKQTERQSSADYLKAAVDQLQHAYEAFADAKDSRWDNLPRPNRQLWLTVARMLAQSQQTASNITQSSHRKIYELEAELWRGRLHDMLLPLKNIPLTYFAESADAILVSDPDPERSPIASASIRVVLEFLEWPEERPDPIGNVRPFSAEEIDRIGTFRYRSVADYLEAVDAMRSGSQDRKQYWRGQFRGAADAGRPRIAVT